LPEETENGRVYSEKAEPLEKHWILMSLNILWFLFGPFLVWMDALWLDLFSLLIIDCGLSK